MAEGCGQGEQQGTWHQDSERERELSSQYSIHPPPATPPVYSLRPVNLGERPPLGPWLYRWQPSHFRLVLAAQMHIPTGEERIRRPHRPFLLTCPGPWATLGLILPTPLPLESRRVAPSPVKTRICAPLHLLETLRFPLQESDSLCHMKDRPVPNRPPVQVTRAPGQRTWPGPPSSSRGAVILGTVGPSSDLLYGSCLTNHPPSVSLLKAIYTHFVQTFPGSQSPIWVPGHL